MTNNLRAAQYAVYEARHDNEDVFVWPTVEWDLLYCHEELSELARVIQKINAPDHARNHDDTKLSLDERLHLEAGQVLMMVFTTFIKLGIDPDHALKMALAKIYETSQRKRDRARLEVDNAA